MKSLTFDEFFALPPGTIFGQATGLPHQDSCGLYRKGPSMPATGEDERCVVFTDAIYNWDGCSWPEPEAESQFIYGCDLEADQPFIVYGDDALDRLAVAIGRGPGWMPGDDMETPPPEPETVPMELAGKWIAWSADGLRISGSGDTPAGARQAAGEAAGEPTGAVQKVAGRASVQADRSEPEGVP